MYQNYISVFIVIIFVSTSEALTSKLNTLLFSGQYDFIDLSHSFNNKTIYWPTFINFTSINEVAALQPDGSWFSQNDLCAGEHGGTHIDAPYHFAQYGLFAGDIPLDKLIVPLVVVDVSKKVNDDSDFVLYKEDLDLKKLKRIFRNKQQSFVIIFKFGWTKYYDDRLKFLGINYEDNSMSFPGLSLELAEWIVAQKNIVGLGVDVASPDPGFSTTYDVHKYVMPAGLFIIEHIKLPENLHLPLSSCTGLILPMKIARGTGAPLRLVAICPKRRLL